MSYMVGLWVGMEVLEGCCWGIFKMLIFGFLVDRSGRFEGGV